MNIKDLIVCLSRLRYNLETNEWTVVASMNIGRKHAMNAVTLDGIFVLGGSDKNYSSLTSVEYYNPDLDKWREVAPMLSQRKFFHTGVSNGFVYVMGGETGTFGSEVSHNIVERYSIENNTWIMVSPQN